MCTIKILEVQTEGEKAMDWLGTQLNILKDGLDKKEQALTEIVNITDNQRTVLESDLGETETRAFMAAMNREKQAFITQVIQCDNMFEAVLKEAGPKLDACPDLYKPQVAELQKRIRRVMDLDVKVRVSEKKNGALIEGKKGVTQAASLALNEPVQKLPLQPDAGKVISAYVKNTRNFKG